MKSVKIALGIDISKDDFHVCLKEKNVNEIVKVRGSRSFNNTETGYKELYEWVCKRVKQSNIKVQYVMEATGVYYEDLAYYLYQKGELVSVVLANKLKGFSKSLNKNR
jgi:transposase